MNKENLIEELVSIDGIDRKIALKLLTAGIRSISDLESQVPQKLAEKIGIQPKIVKKWVKSAIEIRKDKELVKNEELILLLKNFLNISYEDARILRNVGVFNIEDLANEDPILLSDDTEINVKSIRQWIKKAKNNLKNEKID